MSQYTLETLDGKLNLLSLFHTILGALVALFFCFPLIHVSLGITMLFNPMVFGSGQPDAPPPFMLPMMGGFFVAIGLMIVLFGWAMAVCIILAGQFIKHRKHRTFCLVIAGIECLFQPLGTALGIFSFIVLLKPEVQALFESSPEASRQD